MRLVRLVPLAVLFAITAAACAVKIPPATSFAPADWQRVMSLPPDTHIQVAYVSSLEGTPRKYSFRGSLTSVTASFIEMNSEQGPQRLMAERVTSVSVLKRKPESGVRGAVTGAVVGAILAAPIAKKINESSVWRPRHLILSIPAMALGALIGAVIDSRLPGYHAVEIYRRR